MDRSAARVGPVGNGRYELDFAKDPQVLSRLAGMRGLGVFTTDLEGRFVAWSAGAERITGYASGELYGQPCRMLEGPGCKGFSGLTELLAAARRASGQAPKRGMADQECRVLAKDGRELHLLGHVSLLTDRSDAVYGALGVFADLTEVLRVNAPAPARAEGRILEGLVGQSSAMEEVFRRIRLAADSDVTTLIRGESGTGKELAARAIHSLSERRKGPFIAINCSAIPESLLESELFGHVKGAFTGAIRDRAGVFEAADGGTLLLDEIGDVSPHIQLKLLRVLQEREIQRVGDEGPVHVDVRLLTATNRDLRERVADGRIREDFYYRIRVFDIEMPPLRERRGDIPILAQHFLEQIARERGKPGCRLTRDALDALVRHAWPGNVRELQNTLEHAMVVQKGDTVSLLDLPRDVRGIPRTATTTPGLGEDELTPDQRAERLAILEALEAHDWNRTKTSASLGISRVTLWKKIRRYRLDEGIFRDGIRSELGG